jgi:alkyl sulfatase BDS1-like metallo-beta-lactamase superfamily hydrolase
VLGVTTQDDVDAGRCRIIAPEGFLHETVSENAIAGPAMARRATYQFGPLLPPGPRGHMYCGLGQSIPVGPPGLIAPTEEVRATGERTMVDGIEVEFQLTPETEAPAEMNFFFPGGRWLCMAENCSHTMHNLVPIRGAQVRDALSWSKYINEAIEIFGGRAELMFTSHHWPRWGADDVRGFLSLQRDVYRWIHDQTMRLANHGHTPDEIAGMLELPEEFTRQGHTRGYYGDLVHNSRAVYQRYLSWYDANPAHLNRLAPTELGDRYVDFMGGPDAVIDKARRSFDAGDYRWVVEVVNHLVFADPTNVTARDLQADALEQLGYQSESATFRNAYLMAAQELRNGHPPAPRGTARGRGLVMAMTIEQVFDVIAVRLKSEEVGALSVRVNWTFTDIGEDWVLGLDNRVLHHVKGRLDPAADVHLTLARTTLLAIVNQDTTFVDAITAGDISVQGDAAALLHIFGHLDTFTGSFAIIEP